MYNFSMDNYKELDIKTFNLISTLLNLINDNEEDDINTYLAKYFLNNLENLQEKSIYDIADECYTSRSTVQRFIKSIGYDSFNNIKSKTDLCISHNHRYGKYYTRKNFRTSYLDELKDMMDSIDKIVDSSTISYFIDLIHISNTVVFNYADSSTVAPLDFQEAMLCFKKNIRCVTNGSHSIDLLKSLDENDTIITLSVTGNYALASLSDIEKTKANKVLITLNKSDEFKNVYDKIIYLNQHSASVNFIQSGTKNAYTIYGLTYFLDLMLNKYYEKYYDERKY